MTPLISLMHALDPANPGNLWGPLGAVLAAYGPVRLADNRRRAIEAFVAVGCRARGASHLIYRAGIIPRAS